MKLNFNSKGFSLIEILVVIGIIGILSAVIMISLNRSKLNARDAKRVADVRELLNATQIYFNTNEEYPPDCADTGYAGGCDVSDFLGMGFGADSSVDGDFMEFLSPNFMPQTPTDPLVGSTDYSYMYATNTEYPAGSGQFYHYIIGTRLENTANNTAGIPPATGYEDYYFIGERE